MTYLRYIAIFALTAAAAVVCGRLYALREDKWSVALRALAAALLTYLALQSAVARRMTAEALLPAWGGTAYPGRTALFLALAVAFMALFAADRGEKLLAGLDRAMEKDSSRWLAAAGMTGLFLLWTWRVTVISFMTNDDVTLMRTIARIPAEGLGAAAHAFSHYLFCGLLGLFYRIDPHGYWYGGYHILAIAVSLTVIGRCVLVKASRRGMSALGGMGIFAVLCAGLALPATAELSFTVTPALLGTAAVALTLCRDEAKSRAGRAAADLGCLLMLLLVRLQRTYTAQCVLCFWALAVGYQLLRIWLQRGPDRARRLAALALCAAVGFGLYEGVGRLWLDSSDAGQDPAASAGYAEAEHYRSVVMDYLIDGLTNDELEAAGLPPELSNLLRAWYFMDERVNTDTFKAIADMYYEPSLESGSLAAATSMESAGHLRTMALTALALPLLLALALLTLLRRGRRCWPEILGALGAFGGGAVLRLYLIRQGRFLLRVHLVVVIPAAVMLLLFALSGPAAEKPARAWQKGVAVILGAALCVTAGLSARSVPYTGEAVGRKDVFAFQDATESYASAHPDIYFVTNFISQNLDPFHDAAAYPGNMHLWGGTGVTSDPDRLYADAFFREDVQFMCQRPSTILALLQYLTLDFGPVQARSLSQLTADTFVTDLDLVCPTEGYTGWHEQNGMTYYFRDGQALTGEQVIDGKTYTFAPAGSEARLTAGLTAEGEQVYTTTAYSLIEG